MALPDPSTDPSNSHRSQPSPTEQNPTGTPSTSNPSTATNPPPADNSSAPSGTTPTTNNNNNSNNNNNNTNNNSSSNNNPTGSSSSGTGSTQNTPGSNPAPGQAPGSPTPTTSVPNPSTGGPSNNSTVSTPTKTPTSDPLLPSPSPTPPPLPTPPTPGSNTPNNTNTTTNTNTSTTTTPANPKPDNNQPSNVVPIVIPKGPNNAAVSTITTTISAPNGPPTAHKNASPPSSPPPSDNSNGLSRGAITAIAVVAGVIGFVLLFWVGVQILQSKRRRREEAEMQEIDFDPTGNGSVNGDLPFPRASGAGLERGPTSLSGSNSLNYQNKTGGHAGHYAGAPYGEDVAVASESELVDGGHQVEYDPDLQRHATLGASSSYSAGSVQHYYPANSSRTPAPYTNYPPHPAQYGAPPAQIRYEPPSALSYDYNNPQYPASNPTPHSDYYR